MKKNQFNIFTKKEYDFIPANVIIIKEMNGWLFAFVKDTKWYVNSTNDSKDCPPEEDEKFLKKLVKAIKGQMKLI